MTAVEAQHFEDTKAIKALIQAFFDSINAADSKALKSHFFPAANLTIIRQDPPLPADSERERADAADEKLTVVLRTTIEKFVKLIDDGEKRRKGQPPGPVLHESPDLDATDVKVDALFGSAWSPFRVTFDGVLHHYGIMVYTLGKTEVPEGGGKREWKIEGVTQNYRRTPGWPEGELSGTV
ncbi:hypothetical protein J7T55_009383 [Diaporthe amygdali]|uniref:uncharacterized protein n=1 Tax=Phomopsis amygdali TaxID=1214568 RepID=UPI0022FEECD4|nr:uncharacterized protein J7T55_009383 [Diaporthe amygdali]KAJ0107418.1 hypothetical protein J7T55_009383 [Diaporthe amygdali]